MSKMVLTTLWYMVNQGAVNPEKQGTKAAAHFQVEYWCRPDFCYPSAAYQKFIRTEMAIHSEKL